MDKLCFFGCSGVFPLFFPSSQPMALYTVSHKPFQFQFDLFLYFFPLSYFVFFILFFFLPQFILFIPFFLIFFNALFYFLGMSFNLGGKDTQAYTSVREKKKKKNKLVRILLLKWVFHFSPSSKSIPPSTDNWALKIWK